MKFRKSKIQSETSEVELYPVYENLGEIIDVTLCPKENGSYTKCCLDRKGRVWSWEIEVFYG
jgi:hypothetical protein